MTDSLDASTSNRPPQRTGRGIGWTLLIALVIAVCIAISLAVQLDPERASPEPPPCGGLYNECCAGWEDDWGPCNNQDCLDQDVAPGSDRFDDGRGLFDAEENFADRRRAPTC